MLAPDDEDLPAFRLRCTDGTVATIYESGHSEGLPEGTTVVSNYLHGNRTMRRALATAREESPYE